MSRCMIVTLLASMLVGGHVNASDSAVGRDDAVPGFSPQAASTQLKTEEALFDLLDAKSTARHLR